jgi:signal transduction histidine kinase
MLLAERDFGLPAFEGEGARVLYPVTTAPDADDVRSAVGMVRLELSPLGLTRRRAIYIDRALQISAAVAAVGLLVAVGVGVALTGPLRRLQRATADITEGRYVHAVDDLPTAGPREVVELGAAFRGAVGAVADREATLRDINQQLRETEAARDAMTHMVIHDLKGPIGNVITLLAVLEGAQLDPDDRALVGDVRARCRDLLRTIEQQLDLARLSGGEMIVQRERLEVGELLLGALNQVRALMAAEGFETQFDLPEDDLEIDVDRALMERVLVNLLVNAVRLGASPITLAVRGEAEGVAIEVADAGRGVPAGQEAAVFERFTSLGGGGSGLGLALVRLATEAHGGTVQVRGARFTIWLPA